ncbi:hypothetical protein ABG067_003744 [Albugo candida]
MKWFLSKLDCQDKENADYDNEEHVDEMGYAQRPLFDCDDEDGDNNEVDHGKKEHANCNSLCAYDTSAPSCGSDDQSYPNECMMTCLEPDVKYFHQGARLQHENSSCDVDCSHKEDTICGIDGETYINYCLYAVIYCDKNLAKLPFLFGVQNR